MKSYTDIEQSKKLADILPLESADMALCSKKQPLMTDYISAKKKFSNAGEIPIDPCWSLAALLDVLPLVETHKQTDGHKIYYYVDLYMKRKGKEIYLSTERHESLVDACYEMILKLQYIEGE